MEYLAPSELIPYGKNAKRHPAEQVKLIANSIKQFGFRQPIVVDQNNVVVIGHGRLLAAKRLKLKQVPVERITDLTEDQIRALRLADNSVSESDWNLDLLAEEISDIDIDMGDFGLQLDLGDEEADPEEEEEDDIPALRSGLMHNVFENQERQQFYSNNFFGIPDIYPTQTVGDQMVRFMDLAEIEDPENYIACFYYDDFKFMAAWRNPDKYVEKLREFKAVVSPNFSLYTDFPRALQILSCCRRQWVGAYWQMLGLDVIPNVCWGDKKSFDYCFLGIPSGGVVSVSTVGVKADPEWNGTAGNMFMDGYNEMMRRLHPSVVLFYGDMIEGCEGNIIRCPSYYEQKRNMLNKQKIIGAKRK